MAAVFIDKLHKIFHELMIRVFHQIFSERFLDAPYDGCVVAPKWQNCEYIAIFVSLVGCSYSLVELECTNNAHSVLVPTISIDFGRILNHGGIAITADQQLS